jgi:hypothetical protein
MIASMSERSEKERQALLTFRLSTLIVVLIALLGWKLTDRYFNRIDEATNGFVTRTMTWLSDEPAMNPDCNANARSEQETSEWATLCPPLTSTIKTPIITTIVAGAKTNAL